MESDKRLELEKLSDLLSLSMTVNDRERYVVLKFESEFISATAVKEIDRLLAKTHTFVGINFDRHYLLYEERDAEGGEEK